MSTNIFYVKVAILGLISIKINMVGSQSTMINVTQGKIKWQKLCEMSQDRV